MSSNEALEIINEYGLEFEVSDSSFGDGSQTIQHSMVFDSKRDANDFIKALKTLVNYIEGEI